MCRGGTARGWTARRSRPPAWRCSSPARRASAPCPPAGSGCLYVDGGKLGEIRPGWLGYPTLQDPSDPMGSPLQPDARRLDLGFIAGATAAWSVASMELLAAAGWDEVHER